MNTCKQLPNLPIMELINWTREVEQLVGTSCSLHWFFMDATDAPPLYARSREARFAITVSWKHPTSDTPQQIGHCFSFRDPVLLQEDLRMWQDAMLRSIPRLLVHPKWSDAPDDSLHGFSHTAYHLDDHTTPEEGWLKHIRPFFQWILRWSQQFHLPYLLMVQVTPDTTMVETSAPDVTFEPSEEWTRALCVLRDISGEPGALREAIHDIELSHYTRGFWHDERGQ